MAKVLELQHQSFQWLFRTDFLQDWLVCPRDSQESSPASQFKNINSSALSLFYGSNPYVDPYVTTGKTIALTTWTFVGKMMFLLFNTLSRFVIALLPRIKCLSFKPAVTIHSDFGAQENNVCHYFHFFPTYLPLSDGTECRDLSFVECWVLSQRFHSTLSYIDIHVCIYICSYIQTHTNTHIHMCVYILYVKIML